MEVERTDGAIRYRSERTHRGAPEAGFAATYRAIDTSPPPSPGTLEYFLTERYCLYAADPHGGLHRSEVHHRPWPLSTGEAEIERNDMMRVTGATLPDAPPLVHVVDRIDAIAWLPSTV